MRQPVFEVTPQPKSEVTAYIFAALAGLGAAILGCIGWIVITETTGYEIGFVAIGAAWLVGMAIRAVKGSDSPNYGYLSAVLSLLAVIAGDAGTIVARSAAHEHVGFFDMLLGISPPALFDAMIRNGDLMSIVFYVIAIVAGWRVAMGHRAVRGGGPPMATA